jgi:hypothetical protein
MLLKPFSVGMTRILPVSQQTFATRRDTPKQPSVFQLGIFLKMNAAYEHDRILAQGLNSANLPVLPSQNGRIAGFIAA